MIKLCRYPGEEHSRSGKSRHKVSELGMYLWYLPQASHCGQGKISWREGRGDECELHVFPKMLVGRNFGYRHCFYVSSTILEKQQWLRGPPIFCIPENDWMQRNTSSYDLRKFTDVPPCLPMIRPNTAPLRILIVHITNY